MSPHDELATVEAETKPCVFTLAAPGEEYICYVLGDGPVTIACSLPAVPSPPDGTTQSVVGSSPRRTEYRAKAGVSFSRRLSSRISYCIYGVKGATDSASNARASGSPHRYR